MKLTITIINTRVTLLLLLLPLLFFSCSRKVIPERPSKEESLLRLDSLPVSEIDIPLTISLRSVAGLAERNTDTIYTSEGWPNSWITDGCTTQYMYHFRRGPLRLSADNNEITIGFTGFYKMKGTQRLCAGNIPLTPFTPPCSCGFSEGERKVNVGFRARFSLGNDYRLNAAVETIEPQPIDKCEVCLWKQDITGTVMKQLKSELELAKKAMLDTIQSINLRPYFQGLWNQLSVSRRIYEAGYLQINPEKIRISYVTTRNDSLFFSLGISAHPLLSNEYKPVQTISVPDLSAYGNQSGFSIFLDSRLNYDSLSRLVTRQVQGKRIDISKKLIRKYMVIDSCLIYGVRNRQLVMQLFFSGSDNGIIYLTGKPLADTAQKIVEIRDIDFDLEANDKLLKTAGWLFNRKILNELKSHTRFDMAENMSELYTTISNELNRSLLPGINSSGRVNELSILGIHPYSEYLVVRCSTKGEMKINVSVLPF